MKIIDILVKKANGELENGFKFKYRSRTYVYDEEKDTLKNTEVYEQLGEYYILERYLNDTVEVIEEQKEIKEISYYTVQSAVKGKFEENVDKEFQKITDKLNELTRAVNKLTKEREVK